MSFLIALTILGLFFWSFFKATPPLGKAFSINTVVAVFAGITALISLLAFFLTPQKLTAISGLTVFFLLSTTSALLILTTGQMNSIFIALWLIISLISGIYGIWGAITIFIASSIYTAIIYMDGLYSFDILIQIILVSVIPIIIGSIIWNRQGSADSLNSENREYRNLANELSEMANKSEVVINAIGDGVIAVNSKGTIQLINPAAQILTGWGKQDALTLNYKSILQLVNQNNEALDIADDPIQQVLNNNQQVRNNDLSLMTKTGKKLMVSIVVSPVGEIGSGIIAVFRDITNEKTEERQQAEFISTASHEMRTPVASIEGYLGLALSPQTAQIDERARDFIMKAHASAQHLGHLFQDLLDVTKADDGRMSNNPKVINIITFAHEITQGLRAKANEKGLNLIYKPIPNDNALDKTIPPVYYVNLDNDHIREILNNLIENAIKYTPKGDVVVDINGSEDFVTISVKDSGIGIPIEDMPHLFQKFYRVNNKDTREIGGTGLGLYLSRRLAEMMGGRIWAESVYTKGSTFLIELPRVSSQEASRLKEQAAITEQNEQNSQASTFEARQVLSVIQSPSTPTNTTTQTNKPHEVPRTQTLTPQQIAEYVARQKALIQQQSQQQPPTQTPQPINRQQPITIPNRGPQQ